jgi:hypothetical protein
VAYSASAQTALGLRPLYLTGEGALFKLPVS